MCISINVQVIQYFNIKINNIFNINSARADFLIKFGLIVGAILLIIGIIIATSETYMRRKFKKRVYVD